MSEHAAQPQRAETLAAPSDERKERPERRPWGAVTPFVRALEARIPSGAAGRHARRALERLMDQPEADRLDALPEAITRFEHALVQSGRDAGEVHDELRELVREQHAALLREPAVAHVIEAPYRRADMLSWLLRENVGRSERMSAETQRLQQELARALAEREMLSHELERQRALAEVGLLAAGVAHDFNNVLQVIAGHTAMVRGAISPEHPERESLDKAIAATRRAAELSRRMLELARQESAPAQPFDLNAVVSEVLELVTPSVPRHVRLDAELAEALPPVFADPTDVRRIVLNLIRTHQPISRADLARQSGLQRSTVSVITEQLIGERWVTEGANGRVPRGRRPRFLHLNKERVGIIGVNIRPALTTIALANLDAQFLAQESFPTAANPKQFLAELTPRLRNLMKLRPEISYEGIGISLPGRVDLASQKLVFAPNLAWANFDLKTPLEKATGLPVELENAANACALAEVWCFCHDDRSGCAVAERKHHGI